jgi:hypothetical protein
MSVKTLAAKKQGHDEILKEGENPFSANKVTGYSLNFPIIGTCTPTPVCAETCYFARGPSTWSPSLAKQHRLFNFVKLSPGAASVRIAHWARRLNLSFVRWNGGGDLFPESVECINQTSHRLLDIPQWVVTRLPEFASQIAPLPNVYVHFSVDHSSLDRLKSMRLRAPPGLQWFWSYQCAKGEVPAPELAPVIFRNGYDLAGTQPLDDDCPLNLSESIENVCEGCRRCFDGTAVSRGLALTQSYPRRQ